MELENVKMFADVVAWLLIFFSAGAFLSVISHNAKTVSSRWKKRVKPLFVWLSVISALWLIIV